MSRPTGRLLYLPLAMISVLLSACGTPSATSATAPQASRMTTAASERIAAAAEASGDNDLALSLYAAASADAPTNNDVRLRYADMLVRSGKIGQARDLLIQGLAHASEPLEIRRGLGSVYLLSGNYTQAIAEMDKVLEARPKDLRTLVNKGVASDLMGDHATAQRLYRQALEVTPKDAAIVNDLALSMALEGHVREARDLLEPFRDASDVPERVRNQLKIFSAAVTAAEGSRPSTGQPEDMEIARMALALSSAGSSGPGMAPPGHP